MRLHSSRKASLADCCFQAIDIQSTSKNTVIYKCQCILCGNECTAFTASDNGGSYKWNDSHLSRHLIKCHNVKGGHLSASFFSFDIAPYIPKDEKQETMDALWKKKKTSSKESQNQMSSDPIPNPTVVTFHPIPLAEQNISSVDVMRTMRIIMSDIALSWDKHNPLNELYWNNELATYYMSNKTIPVIHNNIRYYLKVALKEATDYSFSCDCWSVLNVEFKAIAFYIHIYYHRKFISLLLDVKPITNSTNDTIRSSFDQVCSDYGLSPSKYITTDNAGSNVKAFKENRIGGFAHRLNTACTHLTSTSKKVVGNLQIVERKMISDFFSVAEHICQVFRGSQWHPFKKWFHTNKNSFPDIAGCKITKPAKPCQTRWIGRLVYLNWLQQCGIAAFRYLLYTGVTSIDLVSFHDCLMQLPNVLIILNVMNNALELLAAESKSSAHLVIPLLRHMNNIFKEMDEKLNTYQTTLTSDFVSKKRKMDKQPPPQSINHSMDIESDDDDYEEEEEDDILFSFTGNEEKVNETSIAKLILKCFRYELKEGCLNVTGMEEKIFKAAACCYPHLGDYSKKVLDECIEEGSKKYNEVLNGIELPRNCSTLANCLEAVMGNFFHDTHDEKDSPFRKALLYCKDGDKGVRLTGNHKLVVNDCFSKYLNMKPAQLSKTLVSVSRAKANNHSNRTTMDYDREIEFIKMLNEIKTSRTIQMIPPQYQEENKEEVGDCLACFIVNEKVETLYDMVFDRMEVCFPETFGFVSKWLGSCLHYPATESACERFFRQLSLVVKKPGRTSLSPEKTCQIAFLHNYAIEIYHLLGEGKKMKYDFYKIMFGDL